MFYLIYKITNNLNGYIYIGKHQTEHKDDLYMGSGKYLWRAYKKYGMENFTKTILEECSSEKEMNQREREIVNEEFCARRDTYNINLGGDGGFNFKNLPDEEKEKIRKGVSDRTKKWWKKLKEENYDLWKSKIEMLHGSFLGKHHSDETKHKISELKKGKYVGDQNPMAIRKWICNRETGENRVILKEDQIPVGWETGKILTSEQKLNLFHPTKNKICIHNLATNEIRYIDKSDILPEGWALGGKSKGPMSEEQKQKLRDFYMIKRQNSAEDNYKKFKPLYDVYIKEGFPAVKEKFGYKFTPVNLVRSFNRYIPEFQQTKKQGKRYDLKNG